MELLMSTGSKRKPRERWETLVLTTHRMLHSSPKGRKLLRPDRTEEARSNIRNRTTVVARDQNSAVEKRGPSYVHCLIHFHPSGRKAMLFIRQFQDYVSTIAPLSDFGSFTENDCVSTFGFFTFIL